jgi:hypothetical protein
MSEYEHFRQWKYLRSLFWCSILPYIQRSLQIGMIWFLSQQIMNLCYVNIFIWVKVWGVARMFQKWLWKLKHNLQINSYCPLQSRCHQELYTMIFISATFGSISKVHLPIFLLEYVMYTAGPPPVTQNVSLSTNCLLFRIEGNYTKPAPENRKMFHQKALFLCWKLPQLVFR